MTLVVILGALTAVVTIALALYRRGLRRKPYTGKHRSIIQALTDFTSRDADTVRWLLKLNDKGDSPKP